MKPMTRIISLLLAALCVCATACAGGNPAETTAAPTVTTAPAEVEAPETEPVDPRMLVKDSLPEGLTFEGKTFNIYVGDIRTNKTFIGGPEELLGDLVEDTVYKRNMMVEDRLKINIETHAVADAYNTIATSVSTFVLANDNTFDLFIGQQFGMTTVAGRQLFMNVYDLPHFNFDQPWWDNSYMEEMSLGKDSRFLLSGDFFMSALEWTDVLFFNKNLYQDLYGDPDELYRQALDGKWTLENLNTLVAGAYSDLNNNGKNDVEDRLGFVAYKMYATTDPFVYSSGIDFTTRDADGFIKLNMSGNEKCVSLLEDLLAFFWQDAVVTETDAKHELIFKEGRSLFLSGMFRSMNSLRDMEQDFAPMPYPKYDPKQESYLSLVHDTAMIGGVPISSLNHDMVGAVLEAAGAESYRTVYPAYYETTLKVKYVRDDISAQIVDLIKDTKATNFIYAYTEALGDIGRLYRTLISGNSNSIAAQSKVYQKMAEIKMKTLIDAFNKNS